MIGIADEPADDDRDRHLRPGPHRRPDLAALAGVHQQPRFSGHREIEHVSADSIVPQQGEPYYIAHVRTATNAIEYYGKKLSISPGMLATVDVITGKRSVLHYLGKPINRARERALTER